MDRGMEIQRQRKGLIQPHWTREALPVAVRHTTWNSQGNRQGLLRDKRSVNRSRFRATEDAGCPGCEHRLQPFPHLHSEWPEDLLCGDSPAQVGHPGELVDGDRMMSDEVWTLSVDQCHLVNAGTGLDRVAEALEPSDSLVVGRRRAVIRLSPGTAAASTVSFRRLHFRVHTDPPYCLAAA